ncbi:hypothetical protein CEXT_99701 [Caerostris extrusa]|uniref:Uncharacterized protein n=1 Tax=Caerostris extrusa TaxID=172846 RepID=A0AAV4SUH8_CAEEX|nr:hypothetical protein CEXT_99701 [Caerostris extrusa]
MNSKKNPEQTNGLSHHLKVNSPSRKEAYIYWIGCQLWERCQQHAWWWNITPGKKKPIKTKNKRALFMMVKVISYDKLGN